MSHNIGRSRSVVTQSSAADRFLGLSATGSSKGRGEVPRGMIHPSSPWYSAWWYTTVLVAAITAFLQPYYISFAPPGLYPYDSAGSILVYTMMVGCLPCCCWLSAADAGSCCAWLCREAVLRCPALGSLFASAASPLSWSFCLLLQFLIVADIAVNFRVARFKDGQLLTDKRQLAIDYLKSFFFIDLLSGECCVVDKLSTGW
jgi:hypothetical protein